MKKKKTLFAILLTLVFAIGISVSGIDVYAANKKYTKTYKLDKKFVKAVKLKSKIKSVKSSDKKVATVKKSGKKFTITTKKKGTAIITVKCKNKKTYKYKVKVSNVEHKHDYRAFTGGKEWTEPGAVYIGGPALFCYCGKEFKETTSGFKELKAHQESVPSNGDTECYTCGYITPGGIYDPYRTYNPEIPYLHSNFCGSCGNYTVSSSVHCMGWGNGWSHTIQYSGTTHYIEMKCKICGDFKVDSWVVPEYHEPDWDLTAH